MEQHSMPNNGIGAVLGMIVGIFTSAFGIALIQGCIITLFTSTLGYFVVWGLNKKFKKKDDKN